MVVCAEDDERLSSSSMRTLLQVHCGAETAAAADAVEKFQPVMILPAK